MSDSSARFRDLLLPLKTCAEATNEGVSTWRKRVREGKVKFVRLGRSIRITREELTRIATAGFAPQPAMRPGVKAKFGRAPKKAQATETPTQPSGPEAHEAG